MGDDFQDLVELGFEGVDRFATHFHDPVVGFAGKHKPKWPGKGGRKGGHHPPPPGSEQQRELSPPDPGQQRDYPPIDTRADISPPPRQYQQYQDLPPPPPGPPPKQRARSEPPGDRYDSDPDYEDYPRGRNMNGAYAPDRRDGEWRDDRGRDGGYDRTVEEREYYGYAPGPGSQPPARNRDPYMTGALVPRAQSPPRYAYAQDPYEDAWSRGRPMPIRRRSSSWSPPRRSDQRRYESPPRRVRSKSPNHHRAVATIVGALVGGVGGSRLKKQEPVFNTVSTVAGAIAGGLAAREAEKVYDRRKERRADDEDREERRERRRKDRERRYS